MFVLHWIFLKKYKKSGPKYKDTLTYIATEGLGNIMGLYHFFCLDFLPYKHYFCNSNIESLFCNGFYLYTIHHFLSIRNCVD